MLYDRRVADLDAALHHAADLIAEYRRGAASARVGAIAGREAVAAALDPALPDDPQLLGAVIDDLVAGAAPGLVCTPGPRYFGFVVGGSVDAALVADLLASGWDQNAFNAALAPAAMAFEDVAGAWLKDLLGIPASASVGFVTGAGAANTVGLAAGRSRVLAARGWDAGRDGLAGAPRVRILASVERHATVAARFACSGSVTGRSRSCRRWQTARWTRRRSRRRSRPTPARRPSCAPRRAT